MKVPGLWLEASLAMIQAAGYKDRHPGTGSVRL